MSKKIFDLKKPCKCKNVIFFKYMDGFYCHKHDASFIGGKWYTSAKKTTKKNKK